MDDRERRPRRLIEGFGEDGRIEASTALPVAAGAS